MRQHLASIACGGISSLLATFVSYEIAAWTPPELHHAPPVPLVGHLVPAPGQSLPASAFEPPDPVALHRHILDRSNLLAPASMYQAQMHAESRYDCDAESPAGAQGCAQFLRATWEQDTRTRLPVRCADAPRTHPECSMLGQVAYMGLVDRWLPDGDFDTRLAGYNAGAGHVRREMSACAMRPGCDPTRWQDSVENICLRGSAACSETQTYIERINRTSRQFMLTASPKEGVRAGLTFNW